MATIVNDLPQQPSSRNTQASLPPDDFQFTSANLIVLNDQVYTLDELKVKKTDVLKTLKSYYANELSAFKQGLTRDDYNAWLTSWENQLAIYQNRTARRASTTAVPNTMQLKPLMIHEGQTCVGRLIQYKPFMYKSSLETMKMAARRIDEGHRDYPPKSETSKFFKEITKAIKEHVPDSTEVIVNFEQDDLDYPMFFALLNGRIRVAGKYRTYHTFQEWRLCTGGLTAADFWQNEATFETSVNTINLYSPATSYVNEIPIGEFLKDDYVTKIHISKGVSPWTTKKA